MSKCISVVRHAVTMSTLPQ